MSGPSSGGSGAPGGAASGGPASASSNQAQVNNAIDQLRLKGAGRNVLRLLTWNIDGLDQEHGDVVERLTGVIEVGVLGGRVGVGGGGDRGRSSRRTGGWRG